MIRDIIVNLSVGGANNTAGDYAVSLAGALEAPGFDRIAAVAVACPGRSIGLANHSSKL